VDVCQYEYFTKESRKRGKSGVTGQSMAGRRPYLALSLLHPPLYLAMYNISVYSSLVNTGSTAISFSTAWVEAVAPKATIVSLGTIAHCALLLSGSAGPPVVVGTRTFGQGWGRGWDG